MLLVIIMTHGTDNEMLSAKDESYHLSNTIIHPIVNTNKTLEDKPKVFIIQVSLL